MRSIAWPDQKPGEREIFDDERGCSRPVTHRHRQSNGLATMPMPGRPLRRRAT